MESKLTLKLNDESIRRAKSYIRHHRGQSLSKLVENYFNVLTDQQDAIPGRDTISPIVASLAGCARSKSSGEDSKSSYTDYLIQKYQ